MKRIKIARFLRSVSVGFMTLAFLATLVILASEDPVNPLKVSYTVNLKYAAVPALIFLFFFCFRRLLALWAGLSYDDGDPKDTYD